MRHSPDSISPGRVEVQAAAGQVDSPVAHPMLGSHATEAAGYVLGSCLSGSCLQRLEGTNCKAVQAFNFVSFYG